MTDTSDLWSAPNLVKAEVWLLGKCDLCGTGPLARTERDGPRVWHFHDQSSENARLAAQDRASGPEAPQGHPSEGTGVPGLHARSESGDRRWSLTINDDGTITAAFDANSHTAVPTRERDIADAARPAHYREAAASLRALGHDTAADALMDTIGSSLTDTARAVVAAVRPHIAAEPPVHDGIHHYLSTGCLHGDTVLPDGRTGHQYCQGHTGNAGTKKPASCKFCQAPCQCPCHQTTESETTR